MNTSITFEYSLWLLIPCLLLAGLYAFLLYRNDFSKPDSPLYKFRKYLSAFRFLSVLGLLILLLSPFIKSRKTETQKPIVALLVDNSESIKNGFKNSRDTSGYFKAIDRLKNKLDDKYEVAVYSAGEKLEHTMPSSLLGKSSNLSDAFEQLNDIYYNQNLGAVVLASDGIFNQGINPIYSTTNATYSIYAIAVGDTVIPKDLKIENAYYNKIAYLHDQFTLKADISATNLSSNNFVVSLNEVDNGKTKLLGTKNLFINSQSYYQSTDFVVPVTKTGIAHYVLSVTNLSGEITYKNNSRDIYVEVLDGRQKVLLVANSPHPDIAALKEAIESNKNYSLEVQFIDGLNAKITDYSLVILHQLPSSSANAQALLTDLKAAKKSIWFIAGSQTNLNDFNKDQTAVTILGSANKYNDATAALNRDFSLFTISEQTQSSVAKLPPLSTFYGEYKSSAVGKNLFTQKINNITTDFPLWSFAEEGEAKTAVLCGEGLWRWKLYDYLQNKNNEAVHELVSKTIQYLSVENDKRPFRVNAAKTIFGDNEAVQFDAQLYNANFELVNGTDIDMKVTDETGKAFDFKFNKNDNYYTLNAGFLPTGSYKYAAVAKLGSNTYKADGLFSVAALQLEDVRTVADFALLRNLSSLHKGKTVSLANVDEIAEDLLSKNVFKPVLYDKFMTESAINLKWIFALILLLLSLEWFIRKWSGGY